MRILVLNAGSSSLKFQLIDTDGAAIAESRDRRLARGVVERIGGQAIVTLHDADGQSSKSTAPIRDHAAAVEHVIAWLTSAESGVEIDSVGEIEAVGHRVVHGGERFTHSTRIDDAVRRELEDLIELAPLHNPHNLRGIAAARAALGPGVPQVAIFDTAFHHSLPDVAYLYAIPYQLYRRHRVRRYGFHGTSHRYVAYRYRQLTGRTREGTRIITLHLGNGASACAIDGGDSVDTSMGFTPLEGLGDGHALGRHRSGDPRLRVGEGGADASRAGLDAQQAIRAAGHLGPHGRHARAAGRGGRAWRPPRTSGHRHVLLSRQEVPRRLPRGDERRRRDRLRRRDRRELAGGTRAHLRGLDWLGIALDPDRNAAHHGQRGPHRPRRLTLEVWVIPTDEELLIARDTWRVVTGADVRY